MTEPPHATTPRAWPIQGSRAVLPGTMLMFAVAAITAFGLILRLQGLAAASLWSDEAFSAYWIHRSLSFIWTDGLVIETTPPLYYMLLKGWAIIFGSDDWSLRLFSAVASTATIPLVFLLASEIFGAAAGVAAALAFALLPMQLFYAQEARVYALLPLFYAMTLLALWRFVGAARAGLAASHRGALVVYALGLVLLIYGHATSVFTVAALSACGLLLLAGTAAGRKALPGFILANAAVALLSVPQLYAILMQAGRQDLNWIQPPDLVALLNVMTNLLVDPVTPQSLFRISCIVSAVATLLLAVLLPFLRLGRMAALLLIGVPMLFFLTVVGLSFLSPFLIPRITIWFGVPIAVLAGAALVSTAPVWLRGGLALALAACIGLGMQGVYVRVLDDKDDWRGLMAYMLPRMAPDDVIAAGPGTSMLPVLHYANGAFGHPARPLFRWEPRPPGPDLFFVDDAGPPPPLTSEALERLVRQGRHVWLVLRVQDYEASEAAVRALDPPPVEIDRRHAKIVLLRW
jgi:mannosyltransferase